MKYLVKGDDGREYGPVDEETLRKWTEAGRVVPHTQVRNVLIKKWNNASEIDFLMPSFAVQGVREEKEKGFFRKFSDHLNALSGGKKKEEETPWAHSFKNKYIHDPAGVALRLGSFAVDFIIIGAFSIFLMLHFSASFTHPAPVIKENAQSEAEAVPSGTKQAEPVQTAASDTAAQPATAEAEPGTSAQGAVAAPKEIEPPSQESVARVNSAFNRTFYILLVFVILYYALSLGIYAQTVGMWFWGIMIAKTDLGEVLMGRAYLFTVLMLLIGVLSPLIVYFNPFKRSIHEMLTGTMIIRIAAKPKA